VCGDTATDVGARIGDAGGVMPLLKQNASTLAPTRARTRS
jgi:hypothetical protein